MISNKLYGYKLVNTNEPVVLTGTVSVSPIKWKGKAKIIKGRGSATKGVRQPVSVNANEIRFSQSSVNGADEIISSMKANDWKGDPIDVVKMSDGKLTTIDNTRVVAAREAGIDAQAIIHDANELLPENLIDRFTTKKGVPKTWGEAIELRIGKQKA
ncbi:hypothetical protein BD780_000810 [Clostridium tetanomorphum]|uniref:hypothetical protein n=1 Tax=Clostridium tetanomorphum TaxID=1553 RepID=UPI000AA9DC72|nr:hypothetical protein [Clostridium tetanomorphum]MBP1863487.1 hypothetical protein [Clostridium tetanomorphum]NRS83585.1 hypothetical protein [Clostridium tetanomorphum]SQC01962.1 Uncharacterised protein [Clostridium tetanomorphum]